MILNINNFAYYTIRTSMRSWWIINNSINVQKKNLDYNLLTLQQSKIYSNTPARRRLVAFEIDISASLSSFPVGIGRSIGGL